MKLLCDIITLFTVSRHVINRKFFTNCIITKAGANANNAEHLLIKKAAFLLRAGTWAIYYTVQNILQPYQQ